MFKDWTVRYRYAILSIALLVCFAGYSIGKAYGFIFYPDEFGYWSYAAKAAGYDWSYISSMGSYYSYGYSLILFPIFKLFTDAVTAYRVALGLNYFLLGVSYFILVWLCGKIFGRDDDRRFLISAIGIFYSANLFYAKTTMVETMLVAVYIIICALIYDYIENNRWITLILSVIALVYIHFLHMRAVGVLIAGIITLLIYFLTNIGKLKHFLIMVLIGAVVLVAGFALKNLLQAAIYGSDGAETIAVNDYAGQLYKLAYIFTKEGSLNFAQGLAGKILYMGLATYGLAYFGIIFSVKRIVGIRKDKRNFVYLFILLSTIGELLINAIYNIRPLYVDSVIYGRYHEFVFPILMVLGAYEILNTGKFLLVLVKTAVVILLQLPMTMMSIDCISRNGLYSIRGCFISGIGFVYDEMNYSPDSFMWKAYIVCSILTVAFIFIIYMTRNRFAILIVVIMAVEMMASLRVAQINTNPSDLGAYRDITIVSKVENLKRANPNRRIVYIVEDNMSYISSMQFMMRDESIVLFPNRGSLEDYSDELNDDDILLLFYQSSHVGEAMEEYSTYIISGRFYVFYNR